MPDLNLQDEGSLENLESSGELGEVAATTEEAPAKKGGRMGMILIVILAVVIVLGGGGYILNKLGVIHIFGPKKAPPSVVQLPEQQPAEQAATAPAGETGQTQMIETPPVDEKAKAPARKGGERVAAKPAAKEKTQPPVKEMPAPAQSGKLGDMKGEYTIQVSAWRDKEIAQEMVKRLEEAGYPAFVEDRAFKGGNWYTVRVGRYPSRKDAELAVQSFAEELKANYWIDKAKAK